MPIPEPVTASTNAGVLSVPASRVLTDSRALAWPALRAVVKQVPPSIRPVCEYHFGWYHGADGTNAGKGLRAALVLECARAVGCNAQAAVPAAVAVELIHNASLIHDDIIDGDTVRRHQPAVWAAFGVPSAILAGDALFFLAIQVANACSASAVTELVAATQRLVDGEHADTTFETGGHVSLAQCLAMTRAKTAALMECACTLGALCGEAVPDRTRALGEFGAHLGMAFQLVDDLLNIWGDPEITGKPTGSDLRRHKKSLPVVAALASGTDAGHRLAQLYHTTTEPLTSEQITHAADLIEQAGAREWARHEVNRELDLATTRLHAAVPNPQDAAALTALTGLNYQPKPTT